MSRNEGLFLYLYVLFVFSITQFLISMFHFICLLTSEGKWKQLGYWVKRQRENYHNESLSDDKRQQLEKVGFDWGQSSGKRGKNTSWDEMFAQLVKYRAEHGNCNVPQQRFVPILVCLVCVLYCFITNFYVSFHFVS